MEYGVMKFMAYHMPGVPAQPSGPVKISRIQHWGTRHNNSTGWSTDMTWYGFVDSGSGGVPVWFVEE